MSLPVLTAATWSEVSALLDEVLALPPEARDGFVEALGGERAVHRDTLRALLAQSAAVETGDFLATLPRLTRVAAAPAGALTELSAGDSIGPYCLLSELGAGGMGAVWLAERSDGALKRKVALKLPRLVWARGLAERMARERDILASLEHPHIARLYDAGVDQHGRPYLALEYVEGQPIDVYARERGLAVKDKLQLLLQVCAAVAFAHSRLVVHRDLKPSNILVTADGQVRLLDFGIAKLMEGDRTQETQLTQLAGRALTLDYASPEQIKGEPIGTTSDVYSLGVVSYELLTGAKPYKLKRGSTAELEEAIATADPAKASDAAAARQDKKALKGDLDAILNKALKKTAAERYPTIDALARDITHHLGDEPVSAQPDAFAYRAAKFLKRYWAQVAAGTAVAVALLAGTGLASWQAKVAREQSSAAQREARHAEAVQEFLLDLFRANSDAQPDPVRARETTARQLLDAGVARVPDQLKDVPEVQERVLGTLRDMYRALGLDEREASMERERLAVRRRLYGDADPRLVESLAILARTTPDRQEASALLQEAERIVGARPDTPADTRGMLLVELARARMYSDVSRMRAYADEAVRLLDHEAAAQDQRATALRMAALAAHFLGDFEPAVALNERAWEVIQRNEMRPLNLALSIRTELADALARRGEVAQAESVYRELLARSLQQNGADHVDTLHMQMRLSLFLLATSRHAESAQLRDAALASAQQDGRSAFMRAFVYRNAASSMFTEGRFALALEWSGKSVEALRQSSPQTIVLAAALFRRGELLLEMGRYEEARALLDEAAETHRRAMGPGLRPIGQHRFELGRARLRLATGETAQALELLRALAEVDTSGTRVPIERVRTQALLAAAHLQRDDLPAAEAAAHAAVAAIEASDLRPYYTGLEAEALLRYGQVLLRGGRAREARGALERAAALRAASDHPSSPWLAQIELALALALRPDAAAARVEAQARRRLAQQPQLGAHLMRGL